MTKSTQLSEIDTLIELEKKRQEKTLMMIASENYPFPEVLGARYSVLNNKYSEGYAGKRYYQGNKHIDEIENIAIENAKKLFGVQFANVQPYSGSPANAAALMALCEPGDTIMGMKLSGGGHLTHGHPKITFSGKFFNSVQYDVDRDGLIDYDEVQSIAKVQRPKLMIIGTTAYPRTLDFKRFSEIAKKVGAYVLADISHIAGLVAGGAHPSPVGFADVITTTTHKTLRGPRGAMIMTNDPELAKKIDRAVFPGLQGGPHNATTAGIALALAHDYHDYAHQVVKNAKVLSEELLKLGFRLTTGGTDNHLMVIDVGANAKQIAINLEEAGIVVNYNTIPHDPNPPSNPSGIRIGTPALTSRGMKEKEMRLIAGWINEVVTSNKSSVISEKVRELCEKFPIPV